MKDILEFDKHLKMLQGMCLDCAIGGITPETFIANLDMLNHVMQERFGEKADDQAQFREERA